MGLNELKGEDERHEDVFKYFVSKYGNLSIRGAEIVDSVTKQWARRAGTHENISQKKHYVSLFSWDNVLFLFMNHRNYGWTSCIGSSNLPPREGMSCSSFNSLLVSCGHSSVGFRHTLWPRLRAPSQYHRSVAVTLERKGKRTSNKNICWGGRLKEVNLIQICENWICVRGTIFLNVEISRVSNFH